MRNFAAIFRRRMIAGFAGDAAPAAAQVVNNPTTGVGTLFRMALNRRDDPDVTTRRCQCYLTSTAAITFTGVLWINSGNGTTPGDWIQVGTALAAIPLNRLFEASGIVEDADAFIQLTPSAPLAGAEVADLFMEEMDL